MKRLKRIKAIKKPKKGFFGVFRGIGPFTKEDKLKGQLE